MQLVYFADPMCSWCWGFQPALQQLLAMPGKNLPMRLVLGGLRAYNTTPMGDTDRDFIRQHWLHVQERTGQPFDFAFFEREQFTYDTEPPCRAVVTAREMTAETGLGSPLAVFEAIQRAFYAHNSDVTATDRLCALAVAHGYDERIFRARFASDEMMLATRTDFAISQKSGVQGFPTLVAGDEEAGYFLVTSGYLGPDAVCQRLDAIEADAAA